MELAALKQQRVANRPCTLAQIVLDNEAIRNPETGKAHKRDGTSRRRLAKPHNKIDCRLELHLCDSIKLLLRLRKTDNTPRVSATYRGEKILRMCEVTRNASPVCRWQEKLGVHDLAGYEGAVLPSCEYRLQILRRTRYHCLRTMAEVFRGLYGRYGAASSRPKHRARQ